VLRGPCAAACDVAALTDGRSSGGFTLEATVAARHANTPDVFVWCLRCTWSSRHPARDLRASPLLRRRPVLTVKDKENTSIKPHPRC